MSLAILFHFLCAQHVSDINISIIRSLRLCCWITTSVYCSWFDVCWTFGVVGLEWYQTLWIIQYYAAISDTWGMTSKVIGFWQIHWCLISSWHFYYLRYMTTTIALTGHWILTKLVLRQDTLILQSLRASYYISDFPKAGSYYSPAFLVIVPVLEIVIFQGVLPPVCFEVSQQ